MSDPTVPVAKPLNLFMKMKSPEDAQSIVDLLAAVHGDKASEAKLFEAFDSLAIVHYARVLLLDDNSRLAVITEYDGSLESYLNEFVNHVGDLFNALLEHMEDAPPLPVQEHRQEFHEYVKAHDLPNVTFYAAYPDLTVLDIQAMQG
jgi:hypothetical protein